MAKASKERPTQVGQEITYLKKAEKYLEGADLSFEVRNWVSAASLGIHAIIASCDAVTAKLLHRRFAGGDHQGITNLLGQLPIADDAELKDIMRRVGEALAAKTVVEYDDKPVRQDKAKHILIEARRLVAWAKKHVEKK